MVTTKNLFSNLSRNDFFLFFFSPRFIKINLHKKTDSNFFYKVFNKVPIADFAFFAQINDTEGNLISLWEDKI